MATLCVPLSQFYVKLITASLKGQKTPCSIYCKYGEPIITTTTDGFSIIIWLGTGPGRIMSAESNCRIADRAHEHWLQTGIIAYIPVKTSLATLRPSSPVSTHLHSSHKRVWRACVWYDATNALIK